MTSRPETTPENVLARASSRSSERSFLVPDFRRNHSSVPLSKTRGRRRIPRLGSAIALIIKAFDLASSVNARAAAVVA